MAQQPVNVEVQLGKYTADKAAGKVKIIKLNGIAYYSLKGFDPIEGTPMPINMILNRDQIAAEIARQEAFLASARQVVEDIDNAPDAAA